VTERRCRYCSSELEVRETGRPPDYCSVGCRRAAEYEIRRISRRLERLEDEADRLQRRTAEYSLRDAGVSDWQLRRHQSEAQTVDLQVARARQLMRDLLDDDDLDDDDAGRIGIKRD
jgi:hypothetical protein